MTQMSHRQRLLAALSHKQPDRVPIDFGSTIVTGIGLEPYERLKKALGMKFGKTRVFDQAAQLAQVDEEILNLWDVDTRGLTLGSIAGQLDHDEGKQDVILDEWGICKKYSLESETYFVANSPLSGEISAKRILDYQWPDPGKSIKLEDLKRKIMTTRAKGDHAILLALPTNFILTSMELRGFEDWYLDAGWDKKMLGMLMDQILDIQMGMCNEILTEIGEQIDVVVNFDDLAIQDRLLVSPATYAEILEPRLRRLFDFIHTKTSAKLLHHSDGAIKPIINSLIDIGVDAVNPVQVSAKGMDNLKQLKQEYGDRIAFWGGIDTQHLLPFGTPEEVYTKVQSIIEEMNIDGGYVLCSVHNIQKDVPAENVIAMFSAALD